MTRRVFVVAVLGLGAAVAACCSTPAPQAQTQAGRYRLTSGSSISIATTTDGRSTITVIIPPGSPGAGEHVSTAEALVEPARTAKNQLNDAGVSTVIEVDAAGRLTAIEQTQSK
jgi:hypothetical protein